MKITNKHGLPEPVVALVSTSFYSKGKADYSVTEIISPPRIQRLRQRHYAELESDVSDMIWAFFGSLSHHFLEQHKVKNHINEQRLFVEVDGVTLSGAIDLQKETEGTVHITDYKFTSAWALRADKIEWIQQQNIYAWLVYKTTGKKVPVSRLCEITGKQVSGLRICAFIRDWNRRQAMTDPTYPQASAQMVDIPVWDFDKTEAYVKERVELHREAKVAADWEMELPPCTEDDRWIRETKYAVLKEGRKTAVRVLDTDAEAAAFIMEMPEKDRKIVSISVRKGEAVRCTGNFCGVAKWCTQFKKEQENAEA